jgi:hypothetical protein
MNITANYALTPSEAVAGTYAARRGFYIFGLVIGVITAGWALTLPAALTPSVLGAGIVIVFLPWLMAYLQLARGPHLQHRTVTITDEDFCSTTPVATVRIPWTPTARVRASSGVWTIQAGAVFVVVPRRALAEADRVTFEAFLARRQRNSARA